MSNKEALEVIPSNENSISIVYERPPLHKRVFANFIDILLLVLMFIGFFSLFSFVTRQFPSYQHADETVAHYREESGLFRYSEARKTWENISTWLDNNNEDSDGQKNLKCEKAIDDFIAYVGDKLGYDGDEYKLISDDYDACRLSPNLKYENLPLFVEHEYWDEETSSYVTEIIKNPELHLDTHPGLETYFYEHFYREYTLVSCGGMMIKFFPEYRNNLQTMSNLLFFFELPMTALFAGFTVYLLPTFFFRRNRMTIGKFSMQIGTVDKQYLAVSFGRNLARWSIFYFGVVILSFFTFGVPMIISFSMMAFSKQRQGFQDYLLGINEVDVNRQKIYYTKYEVALDHAKNHKQPINFDMRRNEHL